jgi:hypothetical protein
MKSKEEIEKLAEARYLDRGYRNDDSSIRGYIVSAVKGGFVDGYLQCQEDMSKKPDTDCTCIAFHMSDECYKLGCKKHRKNNQE